MNTDTFDDYMEFSHKPVLLDECLEGLKINPEGIYLDGTLGGAGHSSCIYKRLSKEGILIGLDQDIFALETSKKRLEDLKGEGRLIFANTNFRNMKKVCEENGLMGLDGILLDLGVSSHQLDEAERGFSYQHDAPLDMRMDRRQELTAEIVVNDYSEKQLIDIISGYGEDKWAVRIAKFIVDARKTARIITTGELVRIIKAAVPSGARKDGPHPAKRTFQAIRIEVNNELGILENTIEDGVSLLKKGGRFAIITFHSLEDRIVKNAFSKEVEPCTCPKSFPVCVCGKKPRAVNVTRKPIVAGSEELIQNPRSRSAKLRIIEKI